MSADRWPLDPTRGIASVLKVGRTCSWNDREAATISPVNSHIDLYLRQGTFEQFKCKVDRVVGYLKGNPNITTLTVEYDTLVVEAKTYLLETLANTAKAGDKLNSLRMMKKNYYGADNMDPGFLEQYVRNNRNLRRLDFDLDPGPPALQFVTTLVSSNLANLCLTLRVDRWDGQLAELGTTLAQCSSIESLRIDLYFLDDVNNENRHTEIKCFFEEGVAKMRSLSHVELSFGAGFKMSRLILKGIESLAHERGRALDHFVIDLYHCRQSRENCEENWRSLGLALASVKNLSFRIRGKFDLSMVLPHLKSCESLKLDGIGGGTADAGTKSLGSILSRLPALRTITVQPINSFVITQEVFDGFVNMIKTCDSITKAVLKVGGWLREPPSFRDEVETCCLLNKVFAQP